MILCRFGPYDVRRVRIGCYGVSFTVRMIEWVGYIMAMTLSLERDISRPIQVKFEVPHFTSNTVEDSDHGDQQPKKKA